MEGNISPSYYQRFWRIVKKEKSPTGPGALLKNKHQFISNVFRR